MGTPEPSRSTPGHAAVHVNRRVRTRTHGGVGGREGRPSLPPDGVHGAEVHDIYAPMDDVGTEGVPDKYGRRREGDVVQRHERTEPSEKVPLHPEEGGVVCSLFPVP
jgi:hypothetical protein